MKLNFALILLKFRIKSGLVNRNKIIIPFRK